MILSALNDPIGQAIDDFFHKRELKKLMVFSDITDPDEIAVDYLFRSFNAMPEIEKAALNACQGHVLDVGAAAGSHSLWLKEQGLKTTSIDISEKAVSIIKSRGADRAYCVDFFDFFHPSKFDTLLFLMNGIGIVGYLDSLAEFFEKCEELLATNGQILLDSSDIKYMFDEEDELSDATYYGEVEYIMKYGDLTSDPFPWLFLDFERLKAIAANHGFICEKVVDGAHFDYLAKLTRQ